MKKTIAVLSLAFALLVGFAPTTFAANAQTRAARLQWTHDYATAIENFRLNDRTFLVQANPKNELERQTKIYWILQKIADLQKQILLQTY